jgi:hypothetical protein
MLHFTSACRFDRGNSLASTASQLAKRVRSTTASGDRQASHLMQRMP